MKHMFVSEEETRAYAEELIQKLLAKRRDMPLVLGLIGELGSGKTTFVRGVAHHLGITRSIVSPTFLIKKEYDLFKNKANKHRLVHVDAYRIDSEDEFYDIDIFKDIEKKDTITIIEWADRVRGMMPGHTYWLSFKVTGEETRNITEGDGKKI